MNSPRPFPPISVHLPPDRFVHVPSAVPDASEIDSSCCIQNWSANRFPRYSADESMMRE